MVDRRMSAATALPLLALAACGVEREATRGNLASDAGANEHSGNVEGTRRVYECSAELTSPINDEIRSRRLEHPQPVLLIRSAVDRSDSWTALGHFDGAIHRAADQPFPASARSNGNRLTLEWNIHSERVLAMISWRSGAQDRGNAHYDVTAPFSGGVEGSYSYRMRGECVENPRHPFAAPLGRNI